METLYHEPLNQKIGEIVAADFRKAEVFKKYHIDYCCGGKKTLGQACAEKGLNSQELMAELEQIDATETLPSQNNRFWDLSFLCDYIVNTHHNYVRSSIRFLLDETEKVASNHGARHPELMEISAVFKETATELLEHMLREEQVLFPYIRMLNNAVHQEGNYLNPPFHSIRMPVERMELDHESAAASMERIRSLSDNYSIPDDACMSYRVCYARLKEFEEDLYAHVHLENNVLFPKAAEMESYFLR